MSHVADACRLWRRNAKDTSAASDEPDCAGSDGATRYRAHLEREAQEDLLPFTIQLEAPEQP